jgi:hypothetical protein
MSDLSGPDKNSDSAWKPLTRVRSQIDVQELKARLDEPPICRESLGGRVTAARVKAALEGRCKP